MNRKPFVIEHLCNAPVAKVWAAITDKHAMKHWYFDLQNFEPKTGCEFEFEGGSENKTYTHLCKVTEVVEGKKLQHSWRYKNYEGSSLVTWELFEDGTKTRVKLTHEGLDGFPADNPDFRRENFVAGWTEIVGVSLVRFVETS